MTIKLLGLIALSACICFAAGFPVNQNVQRGTVTVRVEPMGVLPLTDPDYVAKDGAFVYVKSNLFAPLDEIRLTVVFRLTTGEIVAKSTKMRPSYDKFQRQYFAVGVIEEIVCVSVAEVPAPIVTEF